MHIKELQIINFRGFNAEPTIIEFKEGINVILGQNNAGKTTVLKALDILFNSNSTKKLTINDFNHNLSREDLRALPPKISISAKLRESTSEEAYSDELSTVATWLTKLDTPYEAQITFECFLPDRDIEDYKQAMNKIDHSDINEYWKVIDQYFLKKYVNKIYVGNPLFKNQLNTAELASFDFQFLSAIRDVERDLFRGNNTLLKEVIDFYMDYDIKSSEGLDNDQKLLAIQSRKNIFAEESSELLASLKERMSEGEDQILKYVRGTGAGIDNSKPIFEGDIIDTELYSALRLIVEKETGIKLPATSNGLGYNNLLFISLLLSKMQRDASGDYLGSNSKVFSVLAIEEPEAHLHPSMQYKFLQFLKENKESEVNQIFITTHSPNITAAVDLEDLIVLQSNTLNNGINYIGVAYPNKVFDLENPIISEEEYKSREYVKRFLDVTKADLFFARNIILVEGLAEQLVIPQFSRLLNQPLEDSHTTVINIGGRYFDHFLKLFNIKKSKYAINKKIACITDLDPLKKLREKDTSSWEKCYPILLNTEEDLYDYKETSNSLVLETELSDNIRVFTQQAGCSSTFEYELMLKNPNAKELVTESLANKQELLDLIAKVDREETLEAIISRLRKSDFKENVQKLHQSGVLEDSQGNKVAILASRYLQSVNKGEAAQEVAHLISEKSIETPDYIKEAIEWISK